ncbi:MAG: membrane protein insertion efficiency factor YidD [Gammaproteobacteria bacterium]
MAPADRNRSTPAAAVAAACVRAYQLLVSPVLGSRCRFHPTCSEYSRIALRRFGVMRGGWLTIRRLVRCQPFCDGGYDPVPERFSWNPGDAESPE